MSTDYKVRIGNCDFCTTRLDSSKEFPDLFDEKGLIKRFDLFKSARYQEYIVACNNHRDSQKKPCFYFIADCGGDSIEICADCLEKIHKEVKDFK